MLDGRSKPTRRFWAHRSFQWIAVFTFIVQVSFGAGEPPAQEREKLVFAHHMGSLNAGRGAMAWHTRNPELGDPAISNGGDYRTVPLVPYDMWDLTVEESAHLQIRRAMRIGIDGFAVNAWAGGEQAKEFLDALFRVAEEHDYPFYISICPDPSAIDQPDGLTQAVADAISYLLDNHGDSPKLARRDGKPIIFGYQSNFIWVEYLENKYDNDREKVDIARTTEEGWALVGEAYANLEQLVGQELYVQFDMGAFYHGLQVRGVPENGYARAAAVIAQHMPAVCQFLPSVQTDDFARETVAAGAEWGQPIYMNYDNPRTNWTFGGPGTDELRRSWERARHYDSTLLQLTTWNDYHENTNISPGTNNNYAYFDLTGYFIEWWKTGEQPEPDRDRVYLFSRKYPWGTPTFPFQSIGNSDGVIEVLTILPQPARIRVPGRGEYDAPAGLHYQHFPVTPGPVSAELIRNGNVELVVESPEPVTARPFRQDNGITGISSECAAHWREDFGDIPQEFYSEYGDIDGDGLPNWFEMYWFGHFGDMSTATVADPNEDVNGDGFTNLEAYLLGLNPIAAPPVDSTPFHETPLTIPGRIQAEHFDHGGAGVAYLDQTPFNEGGKFRPDEHVDIEATLDAGGGYNVGWTEAGEWLKYTVEVETAGIYDVHLRVASLAGGGAMRLSLGGTDLTGTVPVAATGGWQNWKTLTIPDVVLKAGTQILRVRIEEGGFNFNYVDFVAKELFDPPAVELLEPIAGTTYTANEPVEILVGASASDGGTVKVEFFVDGEKVGEAYDEPRRWSGLLPLGTRTLSVKATDDRGMVTWTEPIEVEVKDRLPFLGSPTRLPGRLEAEHFDRGGPGVAYHDTTPFNEGNSYRLSDAVDLEPTSDEGGGYNLGWTAPGEWLLYTVEVTRTGTYHLHARVASMLSGTHFQVEAGDNEPVRIEVPDTGDWQNWETVVIPNVHLEAGVQTLRIFCSTGDFNLNYLEFQPAASSFSAWRELHFSPEERQNISLSGPYADPSGNGIPNILEYALYRNPREGGRDGLPQLGAGEFDGKRYLTFTFVRPVGIYDIDYRVEVSRNGRDWTSRAEDIVPVSITTEGEIERVKVRDAIPIDALTLRLIRLRVEPKVQ